MQGQRPLILLTNDDGIQSPGLWAAAEALSRLGFVTVCAPREQHSGSSRSMPAESDGVVEQLELQVGGKGWKVYAVGGTPAQAVQLGILAIASRRPDLVVAGINYGENVGSGITISGTVGAALEAASFGIPALAVSLQTETEEHRRHSTAIDFSAAAHFTHHFSRILLQGARWPDVDVLKVDVPRDATPQTAWRVTRVSRQKYYEPVPPQKERPDQPGLVSYRLRMDYSIMEPDSDAYAVAVDHVVAVTPLSVDLTSRIDLRRLQRELQRMGES